MLYWHKITNRHALNQILKFVFLPSTILLIFCFHHQQKYHFPGIIIMFSIAGHVSRFSTTFFSSCKYQFHVYCHIFQLSKLTYCPFLFCGFSLLSSLTHPRALVQVIFCKVLWHIVKVARHLIKSDNLFIRNIRSMKENSCYTCIYLIRNCGEIREQHKSSLLLPIADEEDCGTIT